MPNITKLKLQDDILYTLSAPILLDQEESTSTTSAPSSNYLKTKIDSINSDIYDLQQQDTTLQNNINNIINFELAKFWRVNPNEITELNEEGLDMYNFWNTYGTYKCSSTTRAKEYIHCPVSEAFIMILTGIALPAYTLQIYISYTGYEIATQFCDNWQQENPPATSKWRTFKMTLPSYKYS